jgi:hypothetical protein
VPRGREPVKGRVGRRHGSFSAVTRPQRRLAASHRCVPAIRERATPVASESPGDRRARPPTLGRHEELAYGRAPCKAALLKNTEQRRAAWGDWV